MSKTTSTTSRVRRIYKSLAELGIARIEAEYDGCGDSGCIASVQAFDADGTAMALPATTITMMLRYVDYAHGVPRRTRRRQQLPIDEAIHQWCYDLLEECFPGWENNEGARGTITFDIARRKGSIAHTAYIVEDYDDSVEF